MEYIFFNILILIQEIESRWRKGVKIGMKIENPPLNERFENTWKVNIFFKKITHMEIVSLILISYNFESQKSTFTFIPTVTPYFSILLFFLIIALCLLSPFLQLNIFPPPLSLDWYTKIYVYIFHFVLLLNPLNRLRFSLTLWFFLSFFWDFAKKKNEKQIKLELSSHLMYTIYNMKHR